MVMASGLEWNALANFSSLALSAASERCCWVMSRRVVTMHGWSPTLIRRLEITQVRAARPCGGRRWPRCSGLLADHLFDALQALGRLVPQADFSALRPSTSAALQPKVWVAGLISMNWPVSWRVTQIGSGLTWNRLANFSSEAPGVVRARPGR
jgi:hypothetical protein